MRFTRQDSSCSDWSQKVPERLPRDAIPRRVAAELADGDYVNLGVGLPMQVPQFVVAPKRVMFHAENGVIGFGPMTDGRTSLGVRLNQVHWFKGGIAELRIHSRALLVSELQKRGESARAAAP